MGPNEAADATDRARGMRPVPEDSVSVGMSVGERVGSGEEAARSAPMRVVVSGDGSAVIDGVPVSMTGGESVEEAVLDTLHGYAVSRNAPVRAAISDPSASRVAIVEVAPDGSSALVEQPPREDLARSGAPAFGPGRAQPPERGRGARQSDDEYESPGLLRRLPVPGVVGVAVAFAVVVPLMMLGGTSGRGGQAQAGGSVKGTAASGTTGARSAPTGSASGGARSAPPHATPSPSASTAGSGAGGALLYASDFAAGARGWKEYGGEWSASGGVYTESRAGTGGNKAVTGDSRWTDYILQGDVRLGQVSANGNAGVLVRATGPATGTDSLDGYYVGISGSTLLIGREKYGWSELAGTAIPGGLSAGTWYHLTVRVVGCSITVEGTPSGAPAAPPVSAAVQDCAFSHGSVGVRDFATAASWRDITVRTAATG